MNRQSIHQQIDLLIKALAEQHQQFRDGNGTIQQMELDLMLQNTRQLYEAILMLNHTNALSSLDEVKTAVMQRIMAEKKAFDRKPEVPKAEVPREEAAVPEKQEEAIHHTNTEEVLIRAIVPQPVEETKEKTVKPKKLSGGVNATLFEEVHTLGDNFEDEESLHKHIASKVPGKTVAENLFRKPIKDLKAAIGINEKFLFINQLFEGNLQEYSVAIEKLNSASDLQVAKQLLATEFASRYNWHNSDEHVQHFMELVERRFIS